MFTHSSIPAITINGEDLSQAYEASSIANDTSSQEAIKDGLHSCPNTLQGNAPVVAPTKKRCDVLRKVIRGTSKEFKSHIAVVPAKSAEREESIVLVF
ncbi:hypothetical protein BELL_0065g00160 [Botrytis elliptica]|uniref:Uncharacterized protein n=1 Tax=Botrytis elliptica TaxID=278938 RepID=A0A4Z1JY77_9HELO|nr:hypothetical protein BELL_0065g00160 [Botrytis elliptica]